MEDLSWLDQKCANCGFTRGSHNGTSYASKLYGFHVPKDYCPGHEGRMDWDKNEKGTVFELVLGKEEGEE